MIETVVPIIIIVISLIAVKKREDSDFLAINQGNALKGIAALLLVIVHIRERLEVVPVAYKVLGAGGYLLVAIFFFYSGFGISKQTIKNEHYVLDRLPKRIIYLIKLIIVSEIIYYATSVVILEREFDVLDMIKCVFGITMLNGALWTIAAMLVIQIVYYIGYRLGGGEKTDRFSDNWLRYLYLDNCYSRQRRMGDAVLLCLYLGINCCGIRE